MKKRKKTKAEKRRQRRDELDMAYRRALGVQDGDPLPNQLGASESAGGARGGRGASRRGEGRFYG